jgi:DNA replication protein DnaC
MKNTHLLGEDLCPIHCIQLNQMGPVIYCKKCVLDKPFKSLEPERVLEKHQTQNNSASYKKLGIPKRHISSTFDNYNLEFIIQKEVCDQLVEYAMNFDKNECKNLVLLGREGTGKTHLACAILKLVVQKGLRVRYINSFDLSSFFVENWKNNNFYERNEVENFKSYDLLILDEYGLYDQTEHYKNYVDKVLYKRYDSEKPTIIISNLIKDQFISKIGFRLWSRLNEDGLSLFELTWPDYRMSSLTKSK